MLTVFVSSFLYTTSAADDLSAKEARKLIARMAGIELPSALRRWSKLK
jgi:hypothetical protein